MKTIMDLVSELKEEMFSSAIDLCSLVSPSAYETAWVAMIPDPDRPDQPLFRQCLEWIIEGQREEGFWGERGTLECLCSSLACMAALKTWDVGPCNIDRGLAFVHAKTEKLLGEEGGDFPRWFYIVFPAMVELAQTKGLNVFPDGMKDVVKSIYRQRQGILEKEASLGDAYHPPLLSYLEALPTPRGVIHHKTILQNQSKDGSLFQSPSATARAFMITGNKGFRLYLESMVQRCRHGGGRLCWFLQHEDIASYMEQNYDSLLSTLLNVYRATEVIFPGENELEEARSFSRTLLERGLNIKNTKDSVVTFNIQREIEHELRLPWLARSEHLEHRVGIEGSESDDYLWMGKASYYRISCLNSNNLLRLAKENYTLRQFIFKNELEQVTRWGRDSGLRDIGFGREKTTYCYYSVASGAYLPSLSDVRMLVCKSAILVTVADDFFDMEGSMDELNTLTEAVRRWDGKELSGHGKVIFDALSDLVDDTIKMFYDRHQVDVTKSVRDLWCETFMSWLKEADWSRRRYAPSIDEYIQTGTTSIAAHTMILPACYLVSPGLSMHQMTHANVDVITKLLMVSARLLNDMQSYEKENEDGKLNLVLLYLKEKPELDIEGSSEYIRDIVNKQKKDFLKMALEDGVIGVPKLRRLLYLGGLKAFQMFFNSTNGFDSPTEMVNSINRAIFEPLVMETWSTAPQPSPQPHLGSKKHNSSIVRAHIGRSFQDNGGKRPLCYSNIEPFGMRVLTDRVFPLRLPIVRHFHRSYSRVLRPPAITKPLLW